MFSLFGLKPAIGRLLTPADDMKPGGHPVAVLSYDYWQRRFNGDTHIVGRKFRLGADLYKIVGVCGKGFIGTEPGTVTDIFIPTMMNTRAIDRPDWGWFRIWVQLGPEVAPNIVLQNLRAAAQAYRQERVKAWGPNASSPERIKQYSQAELNLEPASAGFSSLQKTIAVF